MTDINVQITPTTATNVAITSPITKVVTWGGSDSSLTLIQAQGLFYPLLSNPSGYLDRISGEFIQSQINAISSGVPSESGLYILRTESGNFAAVNHNHSLLYYPITNPSGFITGIDLSSYVMKNETGQFQVTGDYLRRDESGSFSPSGHNHNLLYYPLSNPSGFISEVDLTNYVTRDESGAFQPSGSYLRTQDSGLFSPSGHNHNLLYYPLDSNPSGYVTEVGVSTTINGLSGNAVISGLGNNTVTVSGQTILISGERTDTTLFALKTDLSITGSGLQEQITDLASHTGDYYPISNPSGFITLGEIPAPGASTIVNGLSGQVTISGVGQAVASISGQYVLISGIATDTSSFALKTDLEITGSGLQVQINDLNGNTGDYYPRSNPSGYIALGEVPAPTTINGLSGQITVSGAGQVVTSLSGQFVLISGIATDTSSFALASNLEITGSGLQVQINNLNDNTGSYYTRDNPSGYVRSNETGILQSSGDYILRNETGQFSPTGHNHDSSYYPLDSNPSGYVTSLTSSVASVANSDGTLTISPTTGNVISSLNISHPNLWLGQQIFTASGAAVIGEIVRGAASQTASLQEWQSSASGVLVRIGPSGTVGIIAAPTATSQFISQASAATFIPVISKGAVSQTASLQEWQNSSATVLASITAAGLLGVGVVPAATQQVISKASAATVVPITAQGTTSQTADLFQAIDVSSNIVAKVDVGGAVYAGGAGQSILQMGAVINQSQDNTIAGTFNAKGSGDANLIYTDTVNDRVGIGTSSPTCKLHIFDNRIRIQSSFTPSSGGAVGSSGDMAWDTGYLYICTATNTWGRVALSSW